MIEQLIADMSTKKWLGETAIEWAIAFGICFGVALLLRLVKGAVVSYSRKIAAKTTTEFDDAWVQVIDATAWFFYLAVGALGSRIFLDLNAQAGKILERGLFILVGVQLTLWVQAGITSFLGVWAKKAGTSEAGTAAAAIRFVARLILWTALLLVVLSNLGVELTTIVAGLGVGGVAAALAVQKVLGDLISGLSMYFDRPFDIGDFVIVGDVLGNVTKIGLRTTRIDSLGGEKVVYPNGELVSKCIRNYQRMRERRIVFHFGIEYGLSTKKVQAARDIAREVVESMEGVRFDRAHFQNFGDYSLNFEVVYYVLSADYSRYMDLQHDINMELYRRFEEEEIPFAFPTRTLHHRGLPAPTPRHDDEPIVREA